METRLARKRRSSSVINNETSHSASCRETSQSGPVSASLCKTPHHPRKRVRFSDPGPQLQSGPDYSTGLTPAMLRTSFEEPTGADAMPQTPSRRLQRRRSTPLPRSRMSLDPLWPTRLPSPERVVQFTPLRQMLDSRTQRRIRRVGLSDEINLLEREKRDAAQSERILQTLLQERDALKRELETAKINRAPRSPASPPSEEMAWMPPQARIENIELENTRLREELSFSSMHGLSDTASTEADTIILNDTAFEGATVLVSDSPDMRGLNENQSPIPDEISLLSHGNSNLDASTDVLLHEHIGDADLSALSADLEAARRAKKDLFNACRNRLSVFMGTPMEGQLRQSSPSPDFLDHILPTLTEALTRTTDAAYRLHSVETELSSLGFTGSDLGDILSKMRERFREARLKLERAIPGETPNTGLQDGSSTLSALSARVELLVKSLDDEQEMHEACMDREQTLRGHFNSALARSEAAAKKVCDLEDSISSSARDMLHTRMRLQELENEGKEQSIGIDRLNAALSTYRMEVTSLENLVTELEKDHGEQVAQLQETITEEQTARQAAETSLAERVACIHTLEATVENNRISVCDLTARVEGLQKERHAAVADLEKQAAEQEQHQHDIGFMNVRVSELTTALDAAEAEAEKLHQSNTGLEEQLRLEVQARDNLLDRWAADQARSFAYMKETVNSERRKAKVRSANWQLKSDGLHSDETNFSSEPITPVSTTRFVDVEVGRGKERRRLDSGIGILTEDELFEDEEVGKDGGALLPSDPAELS
ncbi:hypothetical protein FE257_010940 [Aspergillus nanangensis]|uniref:Uncharacterized protein n=1 Tax=Aspergillus nanangensis TaxID=2582783 RepID=A0AAD4CXJ7_ASPNN|nr:hypothetical protein FE257_010940 [Aspergillus nanangensis]